MKKLVVSIVVLGALFLSGCGKKTEPTKETSAKTPTIEVTDSQKHTETFSKVPENVVVFDAGALDTLDQLGLEKVVKGAATKNLPVYLKKYQNVSSAGGIKEPDLEKINALKPDLIFISGRQAKFYDALKAIAPTLYVGIDNTRPMESMKENIEMIGKIFNVQKKAQESFDSLLKQAEELKQKASQQTGKSLILLTNEGQLSAYGKSSRFGLIHDVFGFAPVDETIEASTHGQNVSYEYVLEKNPDYLFVIDRTKAIGGDDSNQPFQENPLIQKTSAYQKNQITFLDPALWYLSGGGLESFDLMTKEVAKALK